MKPATILTYLFLGTAASMQSGEPVTPVQAPAPKPSFVLTHDVDASYHISGGARSAVSPFRNANVSEQNSHFQYVLSAAYPDRPIIRLGVNYDRYDFGFAGPGFIPGALQSVNFVAGLDFKIADILMRIEAQPGFYGDDRSLDSGSFNVPVVFGASYIVSKDFQWVAGLYFNPNYSVPVTGGVGFRWRVADRWVLNAVPPNPRLEFKATDDLTLYAGGQVLISAFRMNNNFGSGTPGRNYRNAWVGYTEFRAGTGASWKFAPKQTLDLEVGYTAYRDFDYHRVGDNFQTKSGALYGQVGLKMNF